MKLNKQIQAGFHDFYCLEDIAERKEIMELVSKEDFDLPFDIFSFDQVYITKPNLRFISGVLAVSLARNLTEIFKTSPALANYVSTGHNFDEVVDLIPKGALVANMYLATINQNDAEALQSLLLGSRSLPIDMMIVSLDDLHVDNKTEASNLLLREGYIKLRFSNIYTLNNYNASLFEHAFD